MDDTTEEILEKTRQRRLKLDSYKQEMQSDSKENAVPSSTKSVKRKSEEWVQKDVLEAESLVKRPSFNETDKVSSKSSLYPLEELESIKKSIDGAAEEAEKEERHRSEDSQQDSSASDSDRPSTRPSARKARFAALAAHLDEFEEEVKAAPTPVKETPSKKRPMMFGRERASDSQSASDSGGSVSGWTRMDQQPRYEPKEVHFNEEVMSKTISTVADSTIDTVADVSDVFEESAPPTPQSGIESFYREKVPAPVPAKAPQAPPLQVAAKASMWEQRNVAAQKEMNLISPHRNRIASEPVAQWKSNLKKTNPTETVTKSAEPYRTNQKPLIPERTAPIKWPVAGGSVAARAAMFETHSPPRKPAGIGLSHKEPFPAGPMRATPKPATPQREKEETEEERKSKVLNLRNRWEVSSMSGTPLHPDAGNDDLVNAAVQLARSRQGSQRSFRPTNSKSSITTTPVKPTTPKLQAKPAEEPEEEEEESYEEEEEEEEESEESEGEDEVPPEPKKEPVKEESSDDSAMDADIEAALESALNTNDQNTDDESTKKKEEDLPHTPLVHSVSFYRNMEKGRKGGANSTPVVVRTPGASRDRMAMSVPETSQRLTTLPSYDQRIKTLTEKESVQKQQILQASRALNLCRTQEVFRGSREEVDAQRALLLATEGRRASLTEIERLSDLRRDRQNEPVGTLGTLTISSISIPLKREFVNHNYNMTGDLLYYFVGLFKFQDTIHSTQMINSDEALRNGKLAFPNYINLTNLPPGFLVRFEVFALRTKREQISHDEKYRLKPGTLKNRGKSSSMVAQSVSSPGGPSAILDPSFQQIAAIDLSLASVKKKQFFLSGVKGLQITSPLEESVTMHLRCASEEFSSVIEEKGFLSAFEEIEGLGSWTRMWCVLKDGRMSFWRYPDDEFIKSPLNVVDLSTCINESVGPTSRELCARPHTLFVDVVCEDVRGSVPTKSTFRIMLSGDTREECLRWCQCINETLQNLRMWNPKSKSRH